MNTPDTVTVTITRGRWSITRSMDLDFLLGPNTDAGEELLALFDEARHAFIDASRHLDQFAEPKPENPPS